MNCTVLVQVHGDVAVSSVNPLLLLLLHLGPESHEAAAGQAQVHLRLLTGEKSVIIFNIKLRVKLETMYRYRYLCCWVNKRTHSVKSETNVITISVPGPKIFITKQHPRIIYGCGSNLLRIRVIPGLFRSNGKKMLSIVNT